MKKYLLSLSILILVGFTFKSNNFKLPSGWFIAGSKPSCYEMGIDTTVKGPDSSNVASIKCIKKTKGFGTLMQQCLPGKYKGKKLKVSARLKLKDVKDWAGIWFRTDINNPYTVLSFNNMQDKHLNGTVNWTEYSFEIDVPEETEMINYGALLVGTGQIWMDNFKLEIIGEMTDKVQILSEPKNLDFNQKD